MNIKTHGRVMVLAKNWREGSNRNIFYNLAIMNDGEAGNISCTSDAYDKAEVGKENDVVFAYNEQYKSFRIVDVIPPLPEPEPVSGTDTVQETKEDVKPDAAQETKADTKPDTVQVKTAKR